jgi:acyl transferase domain-containing protein
MTEPRPPLAVTGISAIFPGSPDGAGFWRDILAGRDLIREIPESRWLIGDYYDPDPRAPDKTYARRGAFLDPVDFDPLEHGVPPSVVPATDTSQLLALIVAKRVLEEATRGDFDHVDRDRVSVILGVTSAQELLVEAASRLQRPTWVRALREHGLPESEVQAICDRIAASYTPWQESTFPGLLGNVVAGRIANRLNLGGTNCVTDAACASSFSALQMAASELWLGQSDLAIAGGVDTFNDIFMYMCFSKTPALSPSGECRPFAEGSDGTLLGEGLAMLAIRRLEDAERDGDPVYAVVRGIGSSSDGRARSVYAPLPEGQARALRRAYRAAGYGPETVELVEAHGTGTRAGDAAELEALRRVFDESGRASRQWCALGTVKSQIGHTKAAAGVAGLFKAIMAVHHGVLPPTIKVDRPNPGLRLEESPFYLNTRSRPWVRGDDHPRRASVSSFGFGGSNFHVAVEEYQGAVRPGRYRPGPSELVLLSSEDPEALARRCRSLAEESDRGSLALVAHESQAGFDAARPARAAVVASSEEDLREKLERLARHVGATPDRPLSAPGGVYWAHAESPGRIAFLFPGQGSQYPGMGADVAMALPQARSAWDASTCLSLPRPLHEVVFPPPAFDDADRQAQADLLTRTEWAQPALGVASQAMLAVLRAAGVEPHALAGHSFGELPALFAAGAIGQADTVRLARRRGELMALQPSEPGAMLAVALPRGELEALLAEWSSQVALANHNSPEQVVLSGPAPAIADVASRLGERGVTALRLPVSTAFHSPLVAGASPLFLHTLRQTDVAKPGLPVFSNRDGRPFPEDTTRLREQLAEQIAQPVLFADVVDALYAAGVRTFVEVGPGHVLTQLARACLGDRPHRAVALDRKGADGLASLWQGLGQLAVAGVAVDVPRLLEGCRPPADARPRSRPGHVLSISGGNYAKPYPPPGGAAALPGPNPERAPEATASPVAPALPPPPSAADAERAAAYREVQRQTAEAHEAYLRSMAESHAAFLRTSEAALAALTTGDAVALPAAPVAPHPPEPPPAPEPQWTAPPPPAVQAATVPAPPGSLRDALLDVVADKTGYPADMLQPEMQLEADLGIDSIKRVEILAALQERAPDLPEVQPADVAELRTLGQILDFMDRGAAASPAATPPLATSAAAAPPAQRDLRGLLLDVVADKTGYPADMLQPEMQLEADLGIDSIKRVEILGALQERAPDLPEVQPADVAELRTLGQILDFMDGSPASEAPPPPEVERRVTTVVEAPVASSRPRLPIGEAVALTEDGSGVAEALAARLRARGIDARVVPALPEGTRHGVFLGGLRQVGGVGDAVAVNREGFLAAKTVATSGAPGSFITVQDTGGDFGLSGRAGDRAWLGGLGALARTAALEWPGAEVAAIDLERGNRSPAELADVLVDELLSGGDELEVGLPATGARTTLADRKEAAQPGARLALEPGAVVLVSGGGRGVTSACLRALAESQRLRFVLLGRTPLEDEPPAYGDARDAAALQQVVISEARTTSSEPPQPTEVRRRVGRILANRELRATLRDLEQAGAEARYLVADVCDPEAVRRAAAEARQLGPIRGLIHGAGLLADRRIAEKQPADFDAVFGAKVAGLRSLLESTAEDPLAVIALFSSVAARSGNAGQCDYAMANEVLNQVASTEGARRRGAALVRSLQWGPWEGGMVGPELAERFRRRGVALIPIAAGARQFVAELAAPGAQVRCVLGAGSLPGDDREARSTRRAAVDISIGATTHPYLDGHRIDGTPVVPAVLVLEWFADVAQRCRPDLRLASCRDLQVLSGIRLEHFDKVQAHFWASAREITNGASSRLALELRGEDGRLHYRGLAELTPEHPEPSSARVEEAPDPSSPLAVARIYDGECLFHGASFRAIRELLELSEFSARARLAGARELAWPEGRWVTDPAVLDGGLQLALLHCRQLLGQPSLPTRIGSLTLHRPGLVEGLVECSLRLRSTGRYGVVSDLFFTAADGTPLAELREVELHVRGASAKEASPLEEEDSVSR